MPIHTITQGDCTSSLAHAQGLPPAKIWNDPDNDALRATRTQDILHPGDHLTIPAKERGEFDAVTEKRHRYRTVPWTVKLQLRLRFEGVARANEPYTLTIGDLKFTGSTDADGGLEETIPADARKGLLRLGDETSAEQYVLRLGELDPVSEVSGVQARLHALGFGPLDIDGIRGDHTKAALRQFQEAHKLNVTGLIDDATRAALTTAYGS